MFALYPLVLTIFNWVYSMHTIQFNDRLLLIIKQPKHGSISTKVMDIWISKNLK